MLRLSRWVAVGVAVAVSVFGAPAAGASLGPWSDFIAPTPDGRVEVGETVLLMGYAYLGEGTPADVTELSLDDGATWFEADGRPGAWRYLLTPTEPGDITMRVRAWYNGNLGDTSPARILHVGTPAPLPPISCVITCTFWGNEAPQDDTDTAPVELGTRFSVDRPGQLTGVTFERGAYRGPVTIHLWAADGTLLREQTAPALIGGRTDAPFTPAVAVQPGTEYIVSYYTPAGGYRSTEDHFTGTMIRAPFIARADAGVYHYGGGFPADSWNHSSYTIYPFFVS